MNIHYKGSSLSSDSQISSVRNVVLYLLTIIQRQIHHPWSFSGLATMMRILLMHYVSLAFFDEPERGWADVLAQYAKSPPKQEAIQTMLF